ncbi:MAG: NADH-quinone oxidoreductase subunit N [Elusimicrobia bacterium]|nr:NADH-quinone oxidoreductase subunit N [Elusimicrobiota bacterium]
MAELALPISDTTNNMELIKLIIPELIISIAGLIIMFFSTLNLRNKDDIILFISSISVVGTIVYLFALPSLQQIDMFTSDTFSVYFKILILAASILIIFLSYDYFKKEKEHKLSTVGFGEYIALSLFAVSGMMFLVSSNNLLMLYISMELISIPFYILTGYLRKDLKSSEGAIKYFLIGAFSSAIMVYGISLLFGITGTLNYNEILRFITYPNSVFDSRFIILALFFILVGFGFKVSLVPFHTWAPDVFEGAPTPVAAFISVAPKIAGLVAIIRFFNYTIPHSSINLSLIFAVLSAVTMTVGNLIAIQQKNIKRLLAYSSISQIGYMFIGITVADKLGIEAVMMYTLAYLFMNLGVWTCVITISDNIKSDEISDYSGISQHSLGLSLVLAVFLLSLTGIPPFSGFIGKFYLFASAIKTNYIWLAVVGVLNSVISLYYYLRIVYYMFFKNSNQKNIVKPSPIVTSVLIITLLFTITIGILPQRFINIIQNIAFNLR